MNAYNVGKASTEPVDAKISDAWRAHFANKHDVAMEQFNLIVSEYPDHVDANYGLALATASVGRKAEAIVLFEKVKTLCEVELQSRTDEAAYRPSMILRMADQFINRIR